MKLLVTGLCGRLGRAIAVEAPEQGHTVLGLDVKPWPVGEVPLPKGVEVYPGSYEDVRTLEALLPGCDAIIHTAGPHGEFVERVSLAGFLRSNVEAVANLLEVGIRHGVRRVALSSTMEVLLGRDWTASGATLVDEQSAPACDSAYSISRLLQEHLGRELSRLRGISVGSLRFMAFGYGEDARLGPSLLARAITAADAARACLRAVAVDGLEGEVFNIGPKTPLTNRDILAAAKDPVGVVERHFPGAAGIVKASGHALTPAHFWPITSIRKARFVLGWEPRYTFETWLVERGWQGRPHPPP